MFSAVSGPLKPGDVGVIEKDDESGAYLLLSFVCVLCMCMCLSQCCVLQCVLCVV